MLISGTCGSILLLLFLVNSSDENLASKVSRKIYQRVHQVKTLAPKSVIPTPASTNSLEDSSDKFWGKKFLNTDKNYSRNFLALRQHLHHKFLQDEQLCAFYKLLNLPQALTTNSRLFFCTMLQLS